MPQKAEASNCLERPPFFFIAVPGRTEQEKKYHTERLNYLSRECSKIIPAGFGYIDPQDKPHAFLGGKRVDPVTLKVLDRNDGAHDAKEE